MRTGYNDYQYYVVPNLPEVRTYLDSVGFRDFTGAISADGNYMIIDKRDSEIIDIPVEYRVSKMDK